MADPIQLAADGTLIVNQASVSPFAGSFFGDYFIVTLILIIIAIVFVPFGIKGMIDVYRWADRNFIKPSKGWVLARQRMPNDRVRTTWIIPTGKMAMFKTMDGKMIEQPIKFNKGWMIHDGNIPLIELDQHGKQVFLGEGLYESSISQEDITRGYGAAYNLGKLVGGEDMMAQLKMYLLVTMIIGVATIVLVAYGIYYNSVAISSIPIIDQNALAKQMALEFINATSSQAFNPNVPTVGG